MASPPSILRRLPWTYILLSVLIVAAYVLVMRLMGRVWFCSCGFSLWSGDPSGPSTSQDFLDPYSFTHVIHGILIYAALRFLLPKLTVTQRLVAALLIEVVWEITENTPFVIGLYRAQTLSRGYVGDSILNSAGDVFCCMIGFWFSLRLPAWATAMLLVGIELLLLLAIRDNLTLNIIQLIHPIEAIKNWQTGM